MCRTFGLEVTFLTTYCLVIHQNVYDIRLCINYRSRYSFFLLHLDLVLSPKFLSCFALMPHANINFLNLRPIFFRFNALWLAVVYNAMWTGIAQSV